MKRINIEEIDKQNLIKQFTEYLNKTKFTSASINFTTDFNNIPNTKEIPRPTIYISSTAYLKMLLYTRDTDIEIAWHGTVERNKTQNWYHIKDVFLYPQTIAAATVNTDQKEYQEWLQNIEDDDIFNNIRFQGHSHVNMSAFASGTDLNMYHNFLQVLPKNDYYIFMIINKQGNVACFIYDLEKNIIYETQDIDIKIITPSTQDLLNDISKEKEKYCKKHIYNVQYANYHPTPEMIRQMRNHNAQYDPDYTAFDDGSPTEVDRIFAELDNKYKNPTIHKSIKNKKRK